MPEELEHPASVPGGRRLSLRADCERCFGLCCVAPAFKASADFAIDKVAGHPCPHLQTDFRCDIHNRLRQRGFPGCAVYDCFGAGQKVAQITFGGQDWRRTPRIAVQMFTVFTIVRQLHELLWYLTEALTLQPARALYAELGHALVETELLTHNSPDALVGLDMTAHRREVNALLRHTSELVRAGAARSSEVDLIGKDLRGADLRLATSSGPTSEALTSAVPTSPRASFSRNRSSMRRRAMWTQSCHQRSPAPRNGSLKGRDPIAALNVASAARVA